MAKSQGDPLVANQPKIPLEFIPLRSINSGNDVQHLVIAALHKFRE